MSESLIIPVRMDSSAAKAELRDVGQAGRHAGDQTAAAMKQAGQAGKRAGDDINQGMGHAGQGIKAAGSEVKNFLAAQMTLGAAKGLASALGDEYRRVAQEVANASKEYQKFRQSLQGVASLSGQPNTNKFAESEIDRAERARVTPTEAKSFRESFLSKASLYVGEGPDARLSEKDADEVQTRMMEYAKDKGVSQEDMAGFVGGLLAQTRGKTNAKDLLARAGKVFGGLEASSAEVKHLLPMTTRAMAQGFSPEESASTLAMMPEIAPEEESTYLLRAVSALRDRVQKGEGEEFGIKKGMKPYELLTNAVQTIKDRAGKGEDVEDLIAKVSGGEEVSGKAIRGMVDQGPEAFARWRRVVQAIPEDQIEKTIEAERLTESGRQRATDSRFEVEQARMGLRGDELTRRKKIAETELLRNKDFERQTTWTEFAAGHLPGQDDARQQMINRQAIHRARGELGEGFGIGDAKASLNSGATDDLLRELIARLDQRGAMQGAGAGAMGGDAVVRLLQEQNAMIKAEMQANQNRPLVVSMPRPRDR
jgi:hypothetical protein